MDSNAFRGPGRRLGSSSEPTTGDGDSDHVSRRTGPEGQCTDIEWTNSDKSGGSQKPLRSLSRLVGEPSVTASVEHETPDSKETFNTASSTLADVTSVPDSSASKKRKRRASTASTASLPDPGLTTSALVTEPSVQKSLRGEEIVELLTDEDRQQWLEWLEQQNDQADPLQSLETWYHDVRPQTRVAPNGASTTGTELKKGFRPSDNPAALSNPTNMAPVLPRTGSISNTIPGNFRRPAILKTWCFGYQRERDIKLGELLQKSHLSSVVNCSFVWDLDFWWSKIDKDSTPCQFIMERDQLEPGTRLQDGAHRIVLNPEKTKILHSKFMVLFFEESKELRLVITSANMLAFDWGEMGGFMENIVFVIDLPKAENKSLTRFGTDFSEYCLSLGLGANIVNQFKGYDWEMTRDLIFVATHGQASTKELPYTGLAGLSQKLAEAGLTNEGEIEIDYVASSIGKLDWEFLSYLYQACKGKGSLPTPTRCKNQCTPQELTNNIRVYFASQETVDGSKKGQEGASKSLCFYPSLYQCLGEERKVLHDCVSRRPGCLMHSKILFVQPKRLNSSDSTTSQHAQARRWFENPHWRSTPTQSAAEESNAGSDTDPERCETLSTARQSNPAAWVYVGSANCSSAAWGNPRNFRKIEMGYNTGSNWECGVIIPVRPLQAGQYLDHLDMFSTIIPVPIRADAESLHSLNRRPFF